MLALERLSKAIRRRRDDLGWTQTYVADQAGLTQEMIAFIERGERNPSLQSLDRILQTLGLDIQLVDTGRPQGSDPAPGR